MSNLFIETEAKIFYLIIIGFLGCFQRKNPQLHRSEFRYVCLFSFIGTAISIQEDIAKALLKSAYIENLCSIVFALSFTFIVFKKSDTLNGRKCNG